MSIKTAAPPINFGLIFIWLFFSCCFLYYIRLYTFVLGRDKELSSDRLGYEYVKAIH
jgi:hypothetical protein